MGKKNSLVKQILTALQGIIIKEILGFSIKSALFVLVKSVLIPATALFIYHLKFAPKIQERSVIKFQGVKITDQENEMIKAEINNCEMDGIFVGFVGKYKGELKFLNLVGKWDFNLTSTQKKILHNPVTVEIYLPNDEMKSNVSHIFNTCNSLIQTMGLGSTKDTNPIYNRVYTEGNSSYDTSVCTIDDNTNAVFNDIKQGNRYNQLIDIDGIRQSNFFNCIKANLNLSEHYSTSLKKIYIYPMKVREYDIAFLSLSFVNDVNGKCFSNDGKLQQELARKIAGKLQQGLN